MLAQLCSLALFCLQRGSHDVNKACEGPKMGILKLNLLKSADLEFLPMLLMPAHWCSLALFRHYRGSHDVNKHVEDQNRGFWR